MGVDRKAPKRAKQRLRQLTARSWGASMDGRLHAINRFVAGWTGYFYLADGERPFSELDEWLRRWLRQVRWKAMEATQNQAAQPARARAPCAEGP